MNGDIFDSKGFHVGVVIGPAIFDLKGKKLYDLKGTNIYRTHPGKAAGLSQARERWRVYDVAREVQAAC